VRSGLGAGGPDALALHPEYDAILRAMLRRVTRSEEILADLSPFDSGLDLCRFLSETAMNRPEAEWEPDLREVIAGARRRLVFEGYEDLHPAPGWHACDRHDKERPGCPDDGLPTPLARHWAVCCPSVRISRSSGRCGRSSGAS